LDVAIELPKADPAPTNTKQSSAHDLPQQATETPTAVIQNNKIPSTEVKVVETREKIDVLALPSSSKPKSETSAKNITTEVIEEEIVDDENIPVAKGDKEAIFSEVDSENTISAESSKGNITSPGTQVPLVKDSKNSTVTNAKQEETRNGDKSNSVSLTDLNDGQAPSKIATIPSNLLEPKQNLTEVNSSPTRKSGDIDAQIEASSEIKDKLPKISQNQTNIEPNVTAPLKPTVAKSNSTETQILASVPASKQPAGNAMTNAQLQDTPATMVINNANSENGDNNSNSGPQSVIPVNNIAEPMVTQEDKKDLIQMVLKVSPDGCSKSRVVTCVMQCQNTVAKVQTCFKCGRESTSIAVPVEHEKEIEPVSNDCQTSVEDFKNCYAKNPNNVLECSKLKCTKSSEKVPSDSFEGTLSKHQVNDQPLSPQPSLVDRTQRVADVPTSGTTDQHAKQHQEQADEDSFDVPSFVSTTGCIDNDKCGQFELSKAKLKPIKDSPKSIPVMTSLEQMTHDFAPSSFADDSLSKLLKQKYNIATSMESESSPAFIDTSCVGDKTCGSMKPHNLKGLIPEKMQNVHPKLPSGYPAGDSVPHATQSCVELGTCSSDTELTATESMSNVISGEQVTPKCQAGDANCIEMSGQVNADARVAPSATPVEETKGSLMVRPKKCFIRKVKKCKRKVVDA
jgi:hypothetical protein